MNNFIQVILMCFAFVILVSVADAQTEKPLFVIGTYMDGNNVTEPRPHESKYLKTDRGGIAVIGDEARMFLVTKVIRKPEKALFVVVEFENPDDGKPVVREMLLSPDAETLQFTSPAGVRGLRIYADYDITVKIYEKKGAAEPIDELEQSIRCYVDTRGPTPKLFNRMKPTS